jgi:putative FmdB family regulatory protein
MALYEYECLACGERFERLCPIRDADVPKSCPKCSAAQSKRRISGGHFELKGGGWYKDGYQKK